MHKNRKKQLVPSHIVTKGDIVFVKMRGFAIWPARVTLVGPKIDVKFFGDNTTAVVSRKTVFPFNKEVDVKKHKHRKLYGKAMKEALIEIMKAKKNRSNEQQAAITATAESKRLSIAPPSVTEATPVLIPIDLDVCISHGQIFVKSNGPICISEKMQWKSENVKKSSMTLIIAIKQNKCSSIQCFCGNSMHSNSNVVGSPEQQEQNVRRSSRVANKNAFQK